MRAQKSHFQLVGNGVVSILGDVPNGDGIPEAAQRKKQKVVKAGALTTVGLVTSVGVSTPQPSVLIPAIMHCVAIKGEQKSDGTASGVLGSLITSSLQEISVLEASLVFFSIGCGKSSGLIPPKWKRQCAKSCN